MAGPSSLKTLNYIHLFSIKPPSLSSMKLKTLLQTFILSHMCRVARSLSRAKSVVIQLLKDMHSIRLLGFPPRRNNNSKKKLVFGSFRLHYNWCSSHRALPLVLETCPNSHVYYDSSWSNSSVVPTTFDCDEIQDSKELSKYLQWLEEKGDEEWSNEIDRLADLFIASCHEKFRLEKQESYRRFQEMMARSV